MNHPDMSGLRNRSTRIAPRLGSVLGLLGLAASALAAVTAVAAVAASSASADTAPTPYLLRERTSGLCITIPFGKSGNNPQLGGCTPTLENTFKIFKSMTDDLAVRVQLYSADACLSVPTDNGTNSPTVESSHDCSNFETNYDKVKDWIEQSQGSSGTVFARGDSDVYPNRCLSVPPPAALGSPFILVYCDTWPHFFDLVQTPLPPPPSHLNQYNGPNNYCATVADTAAPAGVRIRGCTTSSSVDHMYFVPADTSFTTYRVVLRTGKCLDAYAGSGFAPSNGSEVWGTACSRSSAYQVWQPIPWDGGGVSLYNTASKLCLDTANGSYSYNTVVVVGTCRKTQLSQMWSYSTWGVLPGVTLIAATNGSCLHPAFPLPLNNTPVVISSQPGSTCSAPWVDAWVPVFMPDVHFFSYLWAPFGIPSGYCLDAPYGNSTSLSPCDSSVLTQGWGAYADGSWTFPSGTFTLRSQWNPSLALTAAIDSTRLSLQIWTSGPLQLFRSA